MVVGGQPHVGADSLVRARPAVDFMAAVAAVLADEVIALDKLRSGRFGEPLARLEIDNLMVALQAARLLEPLRQHRVDPVVVASPAVLIVPFMPLLRRVGRVRRPHEAGRTPLSLMADRAAERLHRMRTGRAHEEIEFGMRRVGLRHASIHCDFERFAPLRRFQEAARSHLPGEGLPAVDVHDHVASHKPCGRGRRLWQHHADHRILGMKQSLRGEVKPIGILKLLIAVAFHRKLLGCAGRRGEGEGNGLRLPIGRVGGRAGNRLVHALVAGDAAVEPRNVAEVVVQRQMRQPDLVDPQRSVEGVEYRQFEERLPGIGRPVLHRLRELVELRSMVGKRLGSGILAGSQLFERGFERLPMGVGGLKVERGGRDFRTLRIGKGQQRGQLVLRRLFGHTKFVVGAILVEFGLPEFEGAGQQIFAELCPLGDVAQPREQIATKHQPLRGVGLRLQLIEIECGSIRGLGVGRDSANLREERLSEGRIEIGPAGLGQCRLELLRLLFKRTRVLLVHAGRRRPGLQGPELPLVLLPRSIVVRDQHQDRGKQKQDRRHAKHDVQHLEIPPSLFCCRHLFWCDAVAGIGCDGVAGSSVGVCRDITPGAKDNARR